jgi:hypothetical protein
MPWLKAEFTTAACTFDYDGGVKALFESHVRHVSRLKGVDDSDLPQNPL